MGCLRVHPVQASALRHTLATAESAGCWEPAASKVVLRQWSCFGSSPSAVVCSIKRFACASESSSGAAFAILTHHNTPRPCATSCMRPVGGRNRLRAQEVDYIIKG
eukprot:130729-Prymnesium_polylepis.1